MEIVAWVLLLAGILTYGQALVWLAHNLWRLARRGVVAAILAVAVACAASYGIYFVTSFVASFFDRPLWVSALVRYFHRYEPDSVLPPLVASAPKPPTLAEAPPLPEMNDAQIAGWVERGSAAIRIEEQNKLPETAPGPAIPPSDLPPTALVFIYGTPVALEGKFVLSPGRATAPNGSKPQSLPTLSLSAPVELRCEPSTRDCQPESNVTTLLLILAPSEMVNILEYINKLVTVRGKLFHPDNPYQFNGVLLDVDAIDIGLNAIHLHQLRPTEVGTPINHNLPGPT